MDSWGLDTVWAGPFGSFLNMTFTYNKFDIHLHVTTFTNTCKYFDIARIEMVN